MSQESQQYCTNCGLAPPYGVNFCPECGTEIQSSEDLPNQSDMDESTVDAGDALQIVVAGGAMTLLVWMFAPVLFDLTYEMTFLIGLILGGVIIYEMVRQEKEGNL